MFISYVPCACGYHHVPEKSVIQLARVKDGKKAGYHPVCHSFAVALRLAVK